MRRYLRMLLSRLRDVGFVALAVQHFWAGLGSWITLSAGITLAGMLIAAMATSASTHAKAVTTEKRVNALVPTIAAHEQGTFSNVGGNTVTMSSSNGDSHLYADALANFGSANQTAFISQVQKMSAEGAQGLGSSGFGGGVWTAAQSSALQTLQSQMNNGIGAINNLIARLQQNNYMND